MLEELHAQRFAAALASKGTSGTPIYRLAMRLLTERRLRGSLLEFGAGTGHLLGLLGEAGYDGTLTGADILPRPEGLSPAVAWIQADLNQPIAAPERAFDVILSTEVIEHLENPRAVFRELHRLLRPGGTLLLTTPNQESIRSLVGLLMRRHFVAFHEASYPAHITALLERDFERICAETSFAPPRFYYTDAGAIPKLPHIQWQQAVGRFLKGRLFSDNVALVTTRQ